MTKRYAIGCSLANPLSDEVVVYVRPTGVESDAPFATITGRVLSDAPGRALLPVFLREDDAPFTMLFGLPLLLPFSQYRAMNKNAARAPDTEPVRLLRHKIEEMWAYIREDGEVQRLTAVVHHSVYTRDYYTRDVYTLTPLDKPAALVLPGMWLSEPFALKKAAMKAESVEQLAVDPDEVAVRGLSSPEWQAAYLIAMSGDESVESFSDALVAGVKSTETAAIDRTAIDKLDRSSFARLFSRKAKAQP